LGKVQAAEGLNEAAVAWILWLLGGISLNVGHLSLADLQPHGSSPRSSDET